MKNIIIAIFIATMICNTSINHGIIHKHEQRNIKTTKVILDIKSSKLVAKKPTKLSAGNKWDTRKTDRAAYWPPASSPIASIPLSAQATFACIRFNESRNHLKSVNVYSGDGGLYQFADYIWAHYGGLKYAKLAQNASGVEQDAIAVNVYKANGGFYPEWSTDKQCF
jgi:hypothetical protein